MELYSTNQLLALAGVSRRRLQTLGDVVPPYRKGRRGPGRQDRYTITGVLAVAFSRQMVEVGFSYAAAAALAGWVAAQHVEHLEAEFDAGRTVLVVDPEDCLVKLVAMSPDAPRALRLILCQMDLKKCLDRIRRLARKGART